MYVIGTAGHVDHGKSSLVRAITGIDPDRLKEEKEREMTIDLGFAWLELPSGQQVSIVDVPGHEDFIKNMLAGVGGIDAVLLVVAADKSIMPQTREHLAIINLLEVKTGIVALTKIDMVQDDEWLELVKMDIAELLEPTSLAGAPIVAVSARNCTGLIDLEDALDKLLQKTPLRRDIHRPRLSIDRVFTKAGFGTVVTGTLVDGSFSLGDEVEIQPKGLKARIRGLQTHMNKVDLALPGSRVAINLTGVGVSDLERGDAVVQRGWLSGTSLIDGQLRILEDFGTPLKHDMEVEIFSGAAQVLAHTRILGLEEIPPGESGWVQLRLRTPIALTKGDRLIIRQPSPSRTIGGGLVVDPHPRRKHRRFQEQVIRQLDAMASDTPEDILLATLLKQEPVPVRLVVQRSQLENSVAAKALANLMQDGQVYVLDDHEHTPEQLVTSGSFLLSSDGYRRFIERIRQTLKEYHASYPLRMGLPTEELSSRLGLDRILMNWIIKRADMLGEVALHNGTLALPDHQVVFTADQQKRISRVLEIFHQSPYTPPSTADVKSLIGLDVLNALIEQGCLKQVREDVLFLTETYQDMVNKVIQHLQTHRTITLAETRDIFNASRKYTQALLEYMDERRITRRVGDGRIFKTNIAIKEEGWQTALPPSSVIVK